METSKRQRLSRDQRLQIQTLRSTNMTYEAIARVPKSISLHRKTLERLLV